MAKNSIQNLQNFLKIGEIAVRNKLPVSTVRHYTDLGLLKVSSYTNGGQYLYDEKQTMDRINYIQELTNRGFTLENIKEQLNENRAVKKVLIIDDDADFTKLIKDVFTDNYPSWEVNITTDVFNAGHTLADFLPDLLVLDIQLPGVDGYQICTHVRSDPLLKNTKIISVTAYDTPKSKQKMLSCGADVYLPKPIDIELFLASIKELLK